MANPARPGLKFANLDELLSDAKELSAGPYQKAGKWDLGMIMDHLAKTMNVPFDSAAGRNAPWPIEPIMRFFYCRYSHREFYPTFKLPVPGMLAPATDGKIDDQFNALTRAVEKVKSASGDRIVCPPFGSLPMEDFRRMQLLHGAHHLSFLKREP